MVNRAGNLNQYDHVVSYAIRRKEFDHYLLQRSGARTILGEGAKDIQRQDGRWLVNGHIDAAMLVGAGGYFCPVARLLGANIGTSENAIRAQEIEFQMSPQEMEQCPVSSDIPELFFCEDLKGYGWCVRKGNYLNVGLGREDPHRLSEHVGAFVEQLKQHKIIPATTPGKFQGHAYLTYPQSPRRIVDDGVLLIGDAGGLAYGRSGEGIRTAVESGLLAAQTISDANKDYRMGNLMQYEQQIINRYGDKDYNRKSLLPQSIRQSIARLILNNRRLSREIVIDRWFLHKDQQPLRPAEATL
jgi:flavin-dependent dehydrogenase